jgi:AcrR family transcriptional regulator
MRRRPAQSRGRLTFERVLATAEQVLDEAGFEALTTNRIAAEAKINISSIYKYFPNKHAILAALFERHNQQRMDAAREMVEKLPSTADWRRVIDQAVDQVAELRLRTQGGVALRLAMRSSPDLSALDQRANQESAKWFGALLRPLTGLSAPRAERVARAIIEAEVALLDWAGSPEVTDPTEVVRELKTLVKAYLATYVRRPDVASG